MIAILLLLDIIIVQWIKCCPSKAPKYTSSSKGISKVSAMYCFMGLIDSMGILTAFFRFLPSFSI